MKRCLILIALILTACGPGNDTQPTVMPGPNVDGTSIFQTAQSYAAQTFAASTVIAVSSPTDTCTPTNVLTSTDTALPSLAPVVSSPGLSIGQRTKTSGCIAANGLPDPACTPGAVFPDATVAQICTPGYSSSVRNVSQSDKDAVYAAYGIASHEPGQYEVDHLISLELGGSNDIANLWPEAADPRPGFHEKDKIENYLHDQVCNGSMTLQQAQAAFATNWMNVQPSLMVVPIPTATLVLYVSPTAISYTQAPPSGGCCKHCGGTSQPCGDSCISLKYTCHKPAGCACP
jgi:hypothetical protein